MYIVFYFHVCSLNFLTVAENKALFVLFEYYVHLQCVSLFLYFNNKDKIMTKVLAKISAILFII